jgi:hypothetical protein
MYSNADMVISYLEDRRGTAKAAARARTAMKMTVLAFAKLGASEGLSFLGAVECCKEGEGEDTGAGRRWTYPIDFRPCTLRKTLEKRAGRRRD